MCDQEKKSEHSPKWLYPVSLIFGITGIALAAAAAAAMATASQCTVYADYGSRPHTVTFSDFPAFVYLVAATAIAACLEVVAVFLMASKKRKCKKATGSRRVVAALLGAVVPALLYSAAGAAFAAGWDISYYLEPSGRRFSVCRSSVGDRFCRQVHLSTWLALGAAVHVSVAACLTTLWWCHGGGDSGHGSDSDSDSEPACGHGCHCKH